MAWQYHISGSGTDVELTSVNGHSLSISRSVGAVSTASWTVDAPPENAPHWPFGTAVTIYRKSGTDTETLFTGTITNDQPAADSDDESIPYQASDVWWNFDGEVYQQTRKISLADGSLADATYGRALLGRAANGERLTAAQIISGVVSYAAAIGIQIQAGTIDAPVAPPWHEVVDKTLSEIIRTALLFQPDACPWIDHTTTPPTLHVTRRTSMPQQEFAFSGLGQCRVRAYPEQKISGCEITYERSNSHGRTVSVDSAGDTTALRCARFTIPLEFEAGSARPEQEINSVPLGNITKLAWWQRIFTWLPEDAEIISAAISPQPPPDFDHVLVGGQITSWMQDEHGLDAGEYIVSCKARMTVDGKTFTEKRLNRRFTLTNALPQRYTGRFRPSWTEPLPVGVAAGFFAAMSQLQYGGSIVIEEDECNAGRALIGKAINVSGARAAWAVMAAAVAGVEENFDAGTTAVTLGPARHLAPQDMIDLLRASRWRHRVTPQNPDDGGQGNLDDASTDPFAPEDTPSESPGKLSAIALETEGENKKTIIINAAHLDADNASAQMQAWTYVDEDGQQQTMKVLASKQFNLAALPAGEEDLVMLQWNANQEIWEQVGPYEEKDVTLYTRDGILNGTILFKHAETNSEVAYTSSQHRRALQVVSGGSSNKLELDHVHLSN